MARMEPDYDSLLVQDFLTKEQAMAYTQRRTEDTFDEEILPFVNVYRGTKHGLYYIPELRKRVLQMIEIKNFRK